MLSRQLLKGPARALAMKPRHTFFSATAATNSNIEGEEHHDQMTYEEYTKHYVQFFKEQADDMFELQRALNSAFSVDLVPAPEVIVEALRATRRLNSFVLAVRTLNGLRDKIDDEKVYGEYIRELQPTLTELGIATPEELGR